MADGVRDVLETADGCVMYGFRRCYVTCLCRPSREDLFHEPPSMSLTRTEPVITAAITWLTFSTVCQIYGPHLDYQHVGQVVWYSGYLELHVSCLLWNKGEDYLYLSFKCHRTLHRLEYQIITDVLKRNEKSLWTSLILKVARSSKHRKRFTNLIDVMSQKTWNIISTPAITSNNALYFLLLKYNIRLHGKNKTMQNYRHSLQLFTGINQQLFTNTLWKMDP